MANTESAKKRIRQTLKITDRNKSAMNKMRTFIRKLEDAIKTGKKEEVITAFDSAQSIISKTAKKGIIHKKTASRKVSRLFAQVKALSN